MSKKIIAGVSALVVTASMFGIAHVFAGGDGQGDDGGSEKKLKDVPKVETVVNEIKKETKEETKKKDRYSWIEKANEINEEKTITMEVNGRTLEVEIKFNDEGEKIIKAEGTAAINMKEYKESLKNVRERTSEFIAEQADKFSKQADDPRLKQTGNDEGFNYYLKAEGFIESWYKANIRLNNETKALQKDFTNINRMQSIINSHQFFRTSHLGNQGQAMEVVSRSDQWEETPEEMRQAHKYMKQIIHDLDVALNHNGEGETYGVTHILNGDKVDEIDSLHKNELE